MNPVCPVAVTVSLASRAVGLSRRKVAAMVEAGLVRQVAGLLLVADLQKALGDTVQARIAQESVRTSAKKSRPRKVTA